MEMKQLGLEELADLFVGHLKVSSRILLFANNEEIPEEIFQTLDPQSDDIVVLFNKPIHRKWAGEAKRILIFQKNHLGSAWGFQADGSVTQEASEVLLSKFRPIASVFSGAIPEIIKKNLPNDVPNFEIASNSFIEFYPNRGVSKVPSIGFFGYQLVKEITSKVGVRNPIYLIGFSGKYEQIGATVSHDWIYEQHIIKNDKSVCKTHSSGLSFPKPLFGKATEIEDYKKNSTLEIPASQISDEQLLPYVRKCTSREEVISFVRKGGVGVELGVAEGEFSERALRLNHLGYLYGVDMYAGDRGHDNKQYARCLRRLERFRENHTLIKMTFDEALEVFKNETLDFVYIDGYAHTGEDDGRHFDTWWEKLAVGGILAGDDYSEAWPKVIKAVDSFVDRRSLHKHLINCTEPGSTWSRSPTWFVVKRKAS